MSSSVLHDNKELSGGRGSEKKLGMTMRKLATSPFARIQRTARKIADAPADEISLSAGDTS
jgi:hypothetical protein